MFYQSPPPPIYLAQVTSYEKCRQEQLERQLEIESTSPFSYSRGRRIGQVINNQLTNICYEKIREEKANQQRLQQEKEIERLSVQYKKTHPVTFQMGEYFGETYCKILASNPDVRTWKRLSYLAGLDNKMLEIESERQSMIYLSQADPKARQDLQSFNLGFYVKQSYYINCQVRMNLLTYE
jgi:hypothetical protein